MSSPNKTLFVDQGSTFIELIPVVDTSGNVVNLNQFNVYACIRKGYSSTSFVPFEVSIVGLNQVKLLLTAETTASMQSGRYVYDVVVSNDSDYKDRIQEGTLIVTPGVTL